MILIFSQESSAALTVEVLFALTVEGLSALTVEVLCLLVFLCWATARTFSLSLLFTSVSTRETTVMHDSREGDRTGDLVGDEAGESGAAGTGKAT